MAISQVITFNGSPDQLVWKYPEENITTTSQLIVDETHEAILFVNGQAADLFGPGTRTLSLPNIPILNKITTIPTGGVNPFPCKVFYINKVHQLDMLWGTQGAPITVEDPDYQIFLHVMLRGNIALAVEDSRKFLLKLVGLRSNFRPEDVVDKFKGLISSHVKDLISKLMIQHRVGFFTMQAQLMEVSAAVKQRLDAIFEDYGLAIHFFNIESIDVPEKDYDTVKEAKERRASRLIEGITIQEENVYGILKTFAANEGAMGTAGGMMTGMAMGGVMGGVMTDLANSVLSNTQDRSSNTVAGAAQNHNNHFGGQNQGGFGGQAQQTGFGGGFAVDSDFGAPQASQGSVCACGAVLAPDAKFCAECGAKVVKPQGNVCPQCGSPVAPGAKFCMECGCKLAKATHCPECGAELTPGAKFCMECGHKL